MIKQLIKFLLAFFYYHCYLRHKKNIGNRVLLYHSIGSKLDFDTYGISISKKKFLEHLIFLKNNYEIIAIDESYSNNLNRNTISITFDDGFKDNLYALELCEKYNIPFTLYITTGFIGQTNYLTNEEIKKFSRSKICTLGVHSNSHLHLDELDYNEQYQEITKSKKILEDIITKDIIYMSYPHGSYNNDTIKIVKEIGYNIVSSSHTGLNTQTNLDLFRLKRTEIIASDNIKNLKRKIDGYYDYLK